MRTYLAISAVAVVSLLAGTAVLSPESTSDSTSLAAYSNCHFSDGLQIVETSPLDRGVTSREVDTDSGPRQIDLVAGIRVMFAYPNTDFYANVKAEQLPADNYPQLKQALLDNFQHLAHGNTVNAAQASPFNGMEVHGLDRDKLEGGVLGVYLFFDNREHVVTTIYLLNQEPLSRKFQSLDEYRSRRDRFISAYSSCIQANMQNPH
jgi:hypothetical protein